MPSFVEYGSATTPGYHLLLAVIDRLGADDFSIRIVSSLFALSAAVLLSRVVTRVSTPELGAVSSLLFLLNPHAHGSASRSLNIHAVVRSRVATKAEAVERLGAAKWVGKVEDGVAFVLGGISGSLIRRCEFPRWSFIHLHDSET